MEVIEYGNHRDTDSYGYAMFLQDTHGGPAADGLLSFSSCLERLKASSFSSRDARCQLSFVEK